MHDTIKRMSRSTHDDRDFFERYDERKARIAAAKRLPADGHKRRIGRPRSIPDNVREEIVRAYLKSGIKSDVARQFNVDRATVRRCVVAAGIKSEDVEEPPRPTITGVEATTYLDYPVFKRIKTAAKLNNRSFAAEIRAALLKLYG